MRSNETAGVCTISSRSPTLRGDEGTLVIVHGFPTWGSGATPGSLDPPESPFYEWDEATTSWIEVTE